MAQSFSSAADVANSSASKLRGVAGSVKGLIDDVDAIKKTLNSLRDNSRPDRLREVKLSEDFYGEWDTLELIVKDCKRCLDEFKGFLTPQGATKGDSANGSVLYQRNLEEHNNAVLRYKGVLALAEVDFTRQVAMKAKTDVPRPETRGLRTQTAMLIEVLVGTAQGLCVGFRCAAGLEKTQQKPVIAALQEEEFKIGRCLLLCKAILDSAPPETGTHVDFARASEQAKQLIGNFGDVKAGQPDVSVGKAEATGSARQAIGNFAAGEVKFDF